MKPAIYKKCILFLSISVHQMQNIIFVMHPYLYLYLIIGYLFLSYYIIKIIVVRADIVIFYKQKGVVLL